MPWREARPIEDKRHKGLLFAIPSIMLAPLATPLLATGAELWTPPNMFETLLTSKLACRVLHVWIRGSVLTMLPCQNI